MSFSVVGYTAVKEIPCKWEDEEALDPLTGEYIEDMAGGFYTEEWVGPWSGKIKSWTAYIAEGRKTAFIISAYGYEHLVQALRKLQQQDPSHNSLCPLTEPKGWPYYIDGPLCRVIADRLVEKKQVFTGMFNTSDGLGDLYDRLIELFKYVGNDGFVEIG